MASKVGVKFQSKYWNKRICCYTGIDDKEDSKQAGRNICIKVKCLDVRKGHFFPT